MVNTPGTLIALWGKHGCAVVRLNRKVRAALSKARQDTELSHVIPLPTSLLGGMFFGLHPNVHVLQAKWHPMSAGHLGLLCSDNSLRLYNVHELELEEPEQTFRINVESNKVLAFGFGGSFEWTNFSVFYTLSDNAVYAQCPVIPFGCHVPETLLAELKAKQQAEVERLQQKADSIRRASAASTVSGGDGRLRRCMRELSAATRGLRWTELVRTGQVGVLASDETPLVQGPLTLAVDGSDSLPVSEVACDMLVLPTSFPVLVTAFESGLMELRLQVSSVLPCWPTDRSSIHASLGSRSEALVLFDRADIAPSVLKGACTAKLPRGHPLPQLCADPLQHNVWYMFHAGGADCVALPNLDQVLEALMEASNDSEQTAPPPLPRAEMAPLLQKDLCDTHKCVGMCVVALANGEYFLCYNVEGEHVAVIDLLGLTDDSSTMTTLLDTDSGIDGASGARGQAAYHSELADFDRRRPKLIPRVQNLSSGKVSRMSQMSTAVQVADMYKRSFSYFSEGQEILQGGFSTCQKRADAAKELESQAAAKLDSCDSRSENLQHQVDVVLRNDAILRERVSLLSSVLNELQPSLSDAEKSYFSLLAAKQKEVVAMDETVDGLHKFYDSHTAIFEEADKGPASWLESSQGGLLGEEEDLDPRRLALIQENLDRQNELISSMVESLNELRLATN